MRVTQVSTGGAFGAKEDLSVQCHAALLAPATGRPVLRRAQPRRRACASTPSATRCGSTYTRRLRRGRAACSPSRRGSSATPAPTRASATRCSSAPPATPAAPTACRTSTSRRRPSTRTTRRAARCAASASTSRTSRSRACSTCSPSRSASTAGRSAGATRSTTGDRFGTGQMLGPGVGLKQTLLAVRDAYRGARYAGIACGAKNTGIGNGMAEYGRAILRPEADGTRHALPLLDGDGPGRAHRPRADRLRGARPAAGAGSASSSTPSASSRPARRPPRARPCSAATPCIDAARKLKAALNGGRSSELAGQEFGGEFVVDWTTRSNDADEPVTHLAYALGDAGRRSSTTRAGSRR